MNALAPSNPDPALLVEVAVGRLKPLGECSKAEIERAKRNEAEKADLMKRWTDLAQELGEEWCPQTPFVLQIAAGTLTQTTTLPQWRDEVAMFEAVRDMRDKGIGSVN